MNSFKLKNIKREPYLALKTVACDLLEKVSNKTNKGLRHDLNKLDIVVSLIERQSNTRKPLPEVPTVKELRKNGNKVRIIESRYVKVLEDVPDGNNRLFYSRECPEFSRTPHGGQTIVEITTPEGRELRGVATCSKMDSFCRAYGRNLAIYKALNGA